MQSFLQYRRFRSTVKTQLERDRERIEDARKDFDHRHVQNPEASSSSFSEDKIDLENDIERGDYAGLPPESTQRPHQSLVDDEQFAMRANQRPGEVHELVEEMEPEDEDDDDDPDLHQLRTMSRVTTQQSHGTALGAALSGIEVRKRTTHEGGEGNVFVVGYQGDEDPNNPHNWSKWTKIKATFLVAGIGCVVGIASAIDSSALPHAAQEFGVSEVIESMATGLFLVGFGVGSLFAGPFSETVGRNPVYLVTLVLYMLFVMASGLSRNIGEQLAFRFIAGCFAATPLTCAGGTLSDLWNPLDRVWAFPVFANAAFTGPLLGPVMGGFIVQYMDWRWLEWVTLILSGTVTILVLLFQPETYAPILLKWKAQHMRDLTGDERYKAQIEIREESFLHRLGRALYRPFLLTSREPIIMLIALYLTVVYIILFTFLDGYTFIFTDTYGISEGLTGICFLGIIIGLFGASALIPLVYSWAKRDLAKVREAGGDRLPPEFRLWFSMLGGAFAIPISLFWMGWTAYPHISIWSPLAASVLFGFGILCVFITCYQYIIDSYEMYAASALASITLIRYVAAGGMTVVGIPFYRNLGVQYTLTILACISALLVPVPYVFFKYGPWIRSKSKYAIA